MNNEKKVAHARRGKVYSVSRRLGLVCPTAHVHDGLIWQLLILVVTPSISLFQGSLNDCSMRQIMQINDPFNCNTVTDSTHLGQHQQRTLFSTVLPFSMRAMSNHVNIEGRDYLGRYL